MSAKILSPVPGFHFWPKLTYPAARSLCDTWATCQKVEWTEYVATTTARQRRYHRRPVISLACRMCDILSHATSASSRPEQLHCTAATGDVIMSTEFTRSSVSISRFIASIAAVTNVNWSPTTNDGTWNRRSVAVTLIARARTGDRPPNVARNWPRRVGGEWSPMLTMLCTSIASSERSSIVGGHRTAWTTHAAAQALTDGP